MTDALIYATHTVAQMYVRVPRYLARCYTDGTTGFM